MSYCININHPEYQDLLNQSSLSPAVLKAAIGAWMVENNSTEFPSLEQLNIAPSPALYQISGTYYQQKAKEIFFKEIYNQNLTESQINRLNSKVRELSREIGDVDWNIRKSKSGGYYIAGYKNRPVTMDDYYSPYAGGVFRQLKKTTERQKRIKSLENKLLNWAKIHGIEVTSMKKVIEKFPENYNSNAAGIADFVNGLIALSDDLNVDTIPEEIGHFAVEILLQQNNPFITKALEEIIDTNTYNQVKEDYKDIYKNEKDFRKEALGKVLAAEIINQFKLSDELATQENVWGKIKQLASDFINYIKNIFFNSKNAKTDLINSVQSLARSILNEEFLGMYETPGTTAIEKDITTRLLQLKSSNKIVNKSTIKAKEDFVKEVIIQLENRLGAFKRAAKSQASITNLKNDINKLIKLKEKGDIDLAIHSFINLAEKDLDSILKFLTTSKDKKSYNPFKLNQSYDFLEMYDDIMRQLSSDIYDDQDIENSEYYGKMNDLKIKLSTGRGINRDMIKIAAIQVLEAGNLDAYGNKIDPDFDPESIVNESIEDLGYWRLWAGNYKYAENSGILKNAHKILYNALGNVKRFTNRTGNELLRAQEEFLRKGYKVEDLINKKDGKLTHYFERAYDYASYYEAMAKLKEDIAKELEYDSYDDIVVDLLSEEDAKTRRKMWANFLEENSQKITEQTVEGDIITITVPANKYKNLEFSKKMQDPVYANYYNLLIQKKKEAVAKLPVQYRTDRLVYMLPGIRKTHLERLTSDQSTLSKIQGVIKDTFFVDEDDTQFGEMSQLNNKMVPIFFTRELNVKDVTKDVAKSVTIFAEMAENFREMNKISGDLGSVLKVLGERDYYLDAKKKHRTKGVETKEYQALENLINMQLYGIEQSRKGNIKIPENEFTKKLGIADKEFSSNKFAQRLAGLIRNVNLVGNVTTILSGFFKGNIDKVIEDATGLYTTQESSMWARFTFFKNIPEVIGQIGKAKQTNKMHLILQEAGTVDEKKMLDETYRNRGTRSIMSHDILYTGYVQGDYLIKGNVTLSVYDNHRLYNGKFLTRARFYEQTAKEQNVPNNKQHQKNVQKEWEALREKSLWNAYTVTDGNLTVKDEFKPYVTEAILNSVRGKVEHVSRYVDGTLAPTDKGKLSTTIAGQFLMMHRGWFVTLMDSRFKKSGVNFITEEEEIGSYRAFGSLLKNFIGLWKQQDFSTARAYYSTLSPARKRGIQKTMLDFFALLAVSFLAALANIRADEDDEDDFTTQYTAYLMNRLLLEQGSAWSPAELIQIVDEPVVGAKFFKSLSELPEAFNMSETYKKGMYKDWSHAGKWWTTKVPLLKNVYELQYPEEKNRYIKTLVNSSFYDAMSDVEKASFLRYVLRWVVPTGYFKQVDENAGVIYEELSSSNDDYNGFN